MIRELANLSTTFVPPVVNWSDINNKPDFEEIRYNIHCIRLKVDEGYAREIKNKRIKEYYESIKMTDRWYELAKLYVKDKLDYNRVLRRVFDSGNYYSLDLLKTHRGANTFKEYCYEFKN